MLDVKDERLKEVALYAVRHGIEKASENFLLKQESISRYIRDAKTKGFVNTEIDSFINLPNILVLDIETSPIDAGVWGLWKQNVYIDQINADWFMLTWAAKWLFEDTVYSDKLSGEEALSEDDSRISKSIWELLDSADIVIAHNGDKFDLPRLNTRFLINGIQPPSPYQSIDTLKVAKRHFGFSSNKLDFISKSLGFDGKMNDGGYITWKKIVRNGDEESLLLMEEYNKIDVLRLEEVYMALRPWIKSHPNLGLYFDNTKNRCTNCGSENLKDLDGKMYRTTMNMYSVVRCSDCGAIGRSRISALTPAQREGLIAPTAR